MSFALILIVCVAIAAAQTPVHHQSPVQCHTKIPGQRRWAERWLLSVALRITKVSGDVVASRQGRTVRLVRDVPLARSASKIMQAPGQLSNCLLSHGESSLNGA